MKQRCTFGEVLEAMSSKYGMIVIGLLRQKSLPVQLSRSVPEKFKRLTSDLMRKDMSKYGSPRTRWNGQVLRYTYGSDKFSYVMLCPESSEVVRPTDRVYVLAKNTEWRETMAPN